MRLRLSLAGGYGSLSSADTEHVFDERGGVIGRSGECDWVLDCAQKLISRRHAMVIFEGGQFFVYDASSNGVFHNESEEPIGPGWRVAVNDGDTLRMGDFVLAARLLNTEADPGGADPLVPQGSAVADTEMERPRVESFEAEPDLERAPADPARPGVVPADLGHGHDDFAPPALVIPEEWDLTLEDSSPVSEPPPATLARQLSTQRENLVQALCEGLGLNGSGDRELSVEQVRHLGQAMRACLDGVLKLKDGFDEAERRLAGRSLLAESSAAAVLEPCRDAGAVLAALLDGPQDGLADDPVAPALETLVEAMTARQADLARGLEASVTAVAEQFEPERLERRFARYDLGRRRQGWLNRLSGRTADDAADCWAYYRLWYESQREAGYGVIKQVFEQRLAAFYPGRSEPQGGSQTAAARAPEPLATTPQEA